MSTKDHPGAKQMKIPKTRANGRDNVVDTVKLGPNQLEKSTGKDSLLFASPNEDVTKTKSTDIATPINMKMKIKYHTWYLVDNIATHIAELRVRRRHQPLLCIQCSSILDVVPESIDRRQICPGLHLDAKTNEGGHEKILVKQHYS